ncbi:MAG TPA: hydantoinase/oxoprolinase family protein [Clostridia bacterium]|nr:hydantoinase/oxoprolinase family protein [Clostridia bacterium]
MFIGIDIGGTFTDGVIISEQKVIKSIKVPTQEDISHSIENALKQIMGDIAPQKIKQVTLSTTLITNLIMEDKLAKTGLLLFPGPGANPQQLNFACPYKILDGAVDYRGRIIELIDWAEVEEAGQYFLDQQIDHLVVACKFSQRNPSLEKQVVEFLQKQYPHLKVLASYKVSGLLNWVRRANGAFYTLTTQEACRAFQENIKVTLKKLGLNCPIYILKADGGTLPLDVSLRYPLETIFSGPAASTLGALACTEQEITSVVIDIGGTTTDLALLLDGEPLLAERGAFINKYPIPVRSLAISSLALGGDTSLLIDKNTVSFGPRQGPALCVGGPVLTITDILVYSGYSKIASPELIKDNVEEMAQGLQLTPQQFAEQVLMMFVDKLENKLQAMFKAWEEEPAYRIWQVLSAEKERPQALICLGGPAMGIGKFWSTQKKWQVIVPSHSAIANAIGAALARTTLKLDFFADTERKTYTTNIGGLQGTLTKRLKNIEEAKEFTLELFRETAQNWQVTKDTPLETLYEEGFNIVRGWQTTGRIFQIGVQTVPGIRAFLKEVRQDV